MKLIGETVLPGTTFAPDTRPWGERFSEGRAAFFDLARTTDDLQRLKDNSTSVHEARSDAYERRNARILALTGKTIENPYRLEPVRETNAEGVTRTSLKPVFDDWNTKALALAQEINDPEAAREIRAMTATGIDAEAAAITQGAVARQAAAEERAREAGVPGMLRFQAEFGGGLLGTMRDPLQWAAALVGGPEIGTARTVGGRILARVLTEATINAGAEAVVQQQAENWRQQAGVPIGWGGMWQQIGLAAAFGGGLGGLLQGGGEVFKALGKASPEANAALQRVVSGTASPEDLKLVADAAGAPVSDPELKAFSRALEEDAASQAVTAPENVAPREAAQAAQAIEQGGTLPAAPDQPLLAPGNFRFIPADQLKTDAARFQFKEGGDAAGVTDRLKGVTEWKPERAGTLIVFEEADGRLFVADGHQRTGLARRIGEQTGQQIAMPSYVFRAADGFTAEDVRVIAALKNIGEGSGTAIDAAKVLRTGRIDAKATGLPPNSAMVRDAAGLARLSDDAFTMAVNEIVDARYAAVVGRLADDPKLHAQMLEVLQAADPKSIAEAQSMVKDMLAEPTFTEKQESLFGEEDVARMLLKEKAQVRAATLRALRKDRAVFNKLIDEQNRIAEAGNVLDTAANSQRAAQDAIIIEAVDRLSRQVGPVADALNQAARDVAGGQGAATAARGFAEAVRSEIERAGGNLGRIDAARPAELVDPSASGTRAIEPGTPDSAEAAAAALDAAGGATARELEAAGQSNMFAPVHVPAPQAAADLIALQPARTFDELYSGVLDAHQADLGRVGQAIGDELGVKFKNPGLKARATAEAKMGRKAYRSTSQLTDLIRGGFVVDTPGQADLVVARLAENFTVVDEGWAVTPVNYVDRKVLIQFADGTIGEVQIWERAMLEAKSARGHKLYQASRDLADGDPRKAALGAEQKAVYDQVLDGMPDDWRAALGIGGKAGQRSANAASETTRPLSDTSAALTGVQSSPSASTAQAPAGASTAGRNSQSTNVRGDAITSQDSAASPKLQTGAEQTPAGTQILIPGVAEITVRDLVDVEAARPMSGGNAPPPGGLFDEAARDQLDLMDAIPAGNDAEGRMIVTTHAELTAQAERVDYLADVVSACRE